MGGRAYSLAEERRHGISVIIDAAYAGGVYRRNVESA